MIHKKFAGRTTPPSDMMDAARKSLESYPGAFEDLMEQTGGNAPTPDQLCAMVDGCRQARFLAETNELMPSVSMQIVGSVQPNKLN